MTKKLMAVALLLFLPFLPYEALAAWDLGINFRNTYNYPTTSDGSAANCLSSTGPAVCSVAATANYPVSVSTSTAAATNVGWEQAVTGTLNQVAGNDNRLTGVAYCCNAAGNKDFRIDLPQANCSYTIHLAYGDPASLQRVAALAILDTTTDTGIDIAAQTIASNTFQDATDVNRSAANWPANEVGKSYTFTTTILRMRLMGSALDFDTIAHIRVVQGSCSGTALPRPRVIQ